MDGVKSMGRSKDWGSRKQRGSPDKLVGEGHHRGQGHTIACLQGGRGDAGGSSTDKNLEEQKLY